MTNTFRVTFEIVTPESAEQGEAAAVGFMALNVRLREAVLEAGSSRSVCEDAGRWFTRTVTDYRAGQHDEITYAIHPPPTITPASYARLARLLTGRR